MRPFQSVFLPLFLILTWIGPVHSQVSLAPTSLFVHDRTGLGELYVTNQTDNPQEINIRFEFQYPTSDSTGGIFMIPGSPQVDERHGLTGHIRAFPRRLILPPNSSQTIRVQVNPMPGRSDGIYFTRFIVSSNAVTPDVASSTIEEGAIGARIDYVLEQSIPVFYRKGQNETGVVVHDVATHQTADRLQLIPRLSRTGNSPFMGTMRAELYSTDGKLISDNAATAFLYFDEWRRIEIPITDVPRGSYRVVLRFATERNDMSSGDLVQAPPYSYNLMVEL